MEKLNRKYTVYVHINLSNNKKYVGITSFRASQRWRGGKGYKKQKYFYSAIQKYGWNGFKHIILASTLTKDEACQLEQDLIKEFKSNDRRYGYNNSIGGEHSGKGCHHTEATRQKARLSHLGKKHTEETKRKISEGQKGIKNPNYKGPVVCIETSVIYESASYAADINGIARTNLGAVLNGRKKTAGGYHWKYEGEVIHEKE